MLSRNDDSVDTQRNTGAIVKLILDRDLCLGVRANPRQGAITPALGELGIKLVGQDTSERHELLRFVSGVTKH